MKILRLEGMLTFRSMIRTLLAVLIWGCLPSTCLAQSGEWHWQNPTPSSEAFIDLELLGPDRLIGLMANGDLVHSYDGGEHWSVIHPSIQDALPELSKIHFYNDSSAWGLLFGAFSGYYLVHTKDGGRNWDFQKELPISGKIQFENPFMVAMDQHRLYRISYGEARDSMLLINDSSISHFTDVHALNDSMIWAATWNKIFHTTNGGDQWKVHELDAEGNIYSLEMISSDTGWAYGSNGVVLRTIDGVHWEDRSLGVNSDGFVDRTIHSARFFGSEKGFLSSVSKGVHGRFLGQRVFHTSDGGKTWERKKVKLGSYLGVFESMEGKELWLAGTNGRVFKSRDRGENWEKKHDGFFKKLTSVHFQDPQKGWVLGSDSIEEEVPYGNALYHTVDGGESWELLSKKGKSLKRALCISFVDSDHGWSVGGEQSIYRTRDGGKTWREQHRKGDELLYAVELKGEQEAWTVGDSGVILHTENGGKEWVRQESGVQSCLREVEFLSSEKGWAVGEDGVVLRTEDGGKKWEQVELYNSYKSEKDLWEVHFLNDSIGWIGGENGKLFYTKTSGSEWQDRTDQPLDPLSSAEITSDNSITSGIFIELNFLNDSLGWGLLGMRSGGIAGAKKKIVKTTDGGRSWNKIRIPLNLTLFDLHFTDRRHGWTVGENGTILHFSP